MVFVDRNVAVDPPAPCGTYIPTAYLIPEESIDFNFAMRKRLSG
jgi:hypothetical protein